MKTFNEKSHVFLVRESGKFIQLTIKDSEQRLIFNVSKIDCIHEHKAGYDNTLTTEVTLNGRGYLVEEQYDDVIRAIIQ